MEKCRIQNNGKNGVEILNGLHSSNIIGCEFHKNAKGLLLKGGSGRLDIASSLFESNKYHIELQGERSVSLNNNSFQSSYQRGIRIGSNSNILKVKRDKTVSVTNNTFRSNNRALQFKPYKSVVNTIVSKNLFEENDIFAIDFEYSGNTDHGITIKENEFINNSNGDVLQLYTAQEVYIVDNVFQNNSIKTRHSRGNVEAVIAFKHVYTGSMIFKNNSFDNPGSKYQLSTWLQNNEKLSYIDVSYNSWGSSNSSVIFHGMFDFTKRYTLRHQFQYLPFYISPDMTKTSDEIYHNDPIYSPGIIGGHVLNDLTLRNTDYDYLVKDDLNIHPNATLTIEAGVTVVFEKSVGIFVQGQLKILGKVNNKCILRGIPTSNSNGVYLADDEKWGGVRISIGAKRSVIQHVLFIASGFIDVDNNIMSHTLYIEYNHHVIEDVEIQDSASGILQDYTDGTSKVVLQNINIDGGGIGIFTYSTDFTLVSSSVNNASIGIQYHYHNQDKYHQYANFIPTVRVCTNIFLPNEDDIVIFAGYVSRDCLNITTTEPLNISLDVLKVGSILQISDSLSNWRLSNSGTFWGKSSIWLSSVQRSTFVVAVIKVASGKPFIS